MAFPVAGPKYAEQIGRLIQEALKFDPDLKVYRRLCELDSRASKTITTVFEKTEEGVFVNRETGRAALGRGGVMDTTGPSASGSATAATLSPSRSRTSSPALTLG